MDIASVVGPMPAFVLLPDSIAIPPVVGESGKSSGVVGMWRLSTSVDDTTLSKVVRR